MTSPQQLFGRAEYTFAAPDIQYDSQGSTALKKREIAKEATSELAKLLQSTKADFASVQDQDQRDLLQQKIQDLEGRVSGYASKFALDPVMDDEGNIAGYDYKAPDNYGANAYQAGEIIKGMAAPVVDAANYIGEQFNNNLSQSQTGQSTPPQNFGDQVFNFGKAAANTVNDVAFKPLARLVTHPMETAIGAGEAIQQTAESIPQNLYNLYAENRNLADGYRTNNYMTKFGLGDFGDAVASTLGAYNTDGNPEDVSTPQDLRSQQAYANAKGTDARRKVAQGILDSKQTLIKPALDIAPFAVGAGLVSKGLNAVKGLELGAGAVKSQLPKILARSGTQGAVQGAIGYAAANPQSGTTKERIAERSKQGGYAATLTGPIEAGADALKIVSKTKLPVKTLNIGKKTKPAAVVDATEQSLREFEATKNSKLIEDIKSGDIEQKRAQATEKAKKTVRKVAAKKPSKQVAEKATEAIDAARKDGVDMPKTNAEQSLERVADKPVKPENVAKRVRVDVADEPVGGNQPKATPAQNENTLIQQQKENAKHQEKKEVEAAFGVSSEEALAAIKRADPEDRITWLDKTLARVGFVTRIARANMGERFAPLWRAIAESTNTKIKRINSSNELANKVGKLWRDKWGAANFESVENGRYRKWAEGGIPAADLKGNEEAAFRQLRGIYRGYNNKVLKPLLKAMGVDTTKLDLDYVTQASTGKYEFTVELSRTEAQQYQSSGLTVFQDFDIDPVTKQKIPKQRYLAVLGYGDSSADLMKKLKEGSEYYSWKFPSLYENGNLKTDMFQSKDGLSKVRQQINDFRLLINGEDVGKLNEISAARIRENLTAKGYPKSDVNKIVTAMTEGNWASVSADKKLYSMFVGSLEAKKGQMAKIVGNVNPIEAGRQQAVNLSKKAERDTVVNMTKNAKNTLSAESKELAAAKPTARGLADQKTTLENQQKIIKNEYSIEVLNQIEDQARGKPNLVDQHVQAAIEQALEKANRVMYDLTGKVDAVPTEKVLKAGTKLMNNTVSLFSSTKLLWNTSAGAINFAQMTLQAGAEAARDGNVFNLIGGAADDLHNQLLGVSKKPLGIFTRENGIVQSYNRMTKDPWYGELYGQLIGYDPHLDPAFANTRQNLLSKGGRAGFNIMMAPYSIPTMGGTLNAFAMGEWTAIGRGLKRGTKEFSDFVYDFVSNAGAIRTEQTTRLTGNSAVRNFTALSSFVLHMSASGGDAVSQFLGNPKAARNWTYLATATGGPALLAGVYGHPTLQIPMQGYNGLAGIYNANSEGFDLPTLTPDMLKAEAQASKDKFLNLGKKGNVSLTDKALAGLVAGTEAVASGGVPSLFGVDTSNLQVDTGRMFGSNITSGGAIGSVASPGIKLIQDSRDAITHAHKVMEDQKKPTDSALFWKTFNGDMYQATLNFMSSEVTAVNRGRRADEILKTGKVFNNRGELQYEVPKGQKAWSAGLHAAGLATSDEAGYKAQVATLKADLESGKKKDANIINIGAKAFLSNDTKGFEAALGVLLDRTGSNVDTARNRIMAEVEKMQLTPLDRMRNDALGKPDSAASLLIQMQHPSHYAWIWPQKLIDDAAAQDAKAEQEQQSMMQNSLQEARAAGYSEGMQFGMETAPIPDGTMPEDSTEVQP